MDLDPNIFHGPDGISPFVLREWADILIKPLEQSTFVWRPDSNWAKVTSGVPQGLVLRPLLFLIYVNYLPNEGVSYLNKFPDDAQKYEMSAKQQELQNVTNGFRQDAAVVWQITDLQYFNPGKRKVIKMGRGLNLPDGEHHIEGHKWQESHCERDLWLDIMPKNHEKRVVKEANYILFNVVHV